jgi:hypothetical protein
VTEAMWASTRSRFQVRLEVGRAGALALPNATGLLTAHQNGLNPASYQNARQENSCVRRLWRKPNSVRTLQAEQNWPNSGGHCRLHDNHNRYAGNNARAHTGKARTR